MKEKKLQSPLNRREFLRVCGTAVAGGAILVTGAALGIKTKARAGNVFWQIDPAKCTQCGRCETHCVLPVSAVKCIHANRVCGYCDLCGGYYRSNVKDLNTAAENMMCPTGAIERKFVEDPYFEYTINEDLCNGCGKCVKICPQNINIPEALKDMVEIMKKIPSWLDICKEREEAAKKNK